MRTAGDRMIILHDSPSADLAHVQALADIAEGFALFDYVRIRQRDTRGPARGESLDDIDSDGAAHDRTSTLSLGLNGDGPEHLSTAETAATTAAGHTRAPGGRASTDQLWIAQIVQPNQNISTVGGRLDPTILHGLRLMQQHDDVQSVQSVQVFDLLILGQYDGEQLLTPRLRPLPGAVVEPLTATDVSRVIGIPALAMTGDGDRLQSNTIGELLNAHGVPLCINKRLFNYHILVAGGTGSGKSNAAANMVDQALCFEKMVIIHDAKPDYTLVARANTDQHVSPLWPRFERYGMWPRGADNVTRIGFHGDCNPADVDVVVGFRASDFLPDLLAGLFFPGNTPAESNAFEALASVASSFREQMRSRERDEYSLQDILTEVGRRSAPRNQYPPSQQIHELTGSNVQRRVPTRQRNMPWLDAVGRVVAGRNGRRSGTTTSRFGRSMLDQPQIAQVQAFDMEAYAQPGKLLVVDYSRMDDQSYALLLSYFLRKAQAYRKQRRPVGIVQLVDEAHRIFDNSSRHSGTLARSFERVMREGRSVDHSIMMSLQNASQVPPRVMNNLNTKIVMRQNSKHEADAATETMGKDFAVQAMRLGTGHALVSMFESRAVVLAQMAPSPYELLRTDNTGPDAGNVGTVQIDEYDDEL